MKRLISALILTGLFSITAKAEKLEGIIINSSAPVSFTFSQEVSAWDRVSAQGVYQDGTPAGYTVNDGLKSTATITVVSNSSALISTQASVTVNVLSTNSLSGAYVQLNGIRFVGGTDFSVGTTTTTSATNLKFAIDAHPYFEAVSNGSTVTVRYVTSGTAGNGLAASTSASPPLSISAATFSGGINRHTININGNTLTESVDFNANTISTTTAINIKTAINANAILSAQVSASTGSGSAVIVSAIYSGNLGYYINSSTSGFATIGFSPGITSDVDVVNDVITRSDHRFSTGLKLLLATVSGTIPTGLTTGTTYFAIKNGDNKYKLATTANNAVAGTAIDITSQAGNSTFTMTPLSLATATGTGFFWQASNDNQNFSTISITSVTYTAAGSTLFDFAEYAYKYLRLNYTGPTNGQIGLVIKLYGRKD